jgi:hypothetical protein
MDYYTDLLVIRLYSVEQWDDKWIMNGKDLEGSGSGLLEVLSRNVPEVTKENHKQSQVG